MGNQTEFKSSEGVVRIKIIKFGPSKQYMDVSYSIDQEEALHCLDVGTIETLCVKTERVRLDVGFYKGQGYQLKFI